MAQKLAKEQKNKTLLTITKIILQNLDEAENKDKK